MRDSTKGGALTEVTFYILLSLYSPKHGYTILQFIEKTAHGRLTLGAGTLYGALNSLEEKGWIAAQEKWLNQMSAQGYRLIRTEKLLYQFEPCVPGQYQYRIDFIAHKSRVSADDRISNGID